MGYTKLFNSILGSTIWREDPVTKVVWITLLALANRDGVAEASIPGLANFAGVSIAKTEAAIKKFSSPDLYSRSPEFEGRRIEAIDGGWRLLNHGKYRQKMSPEDIREQNRIRQQRSRELKKSAECNAQSVTGRDNRDDSDISRESRHTDTEADTEAEGKADEKPNTLAHSPNEPESDSDSSPPSPVQANKEKLSRLAAEIYDLYPRKVGKADALKAIKKAIITVARRDFDGNHDLAADWLKGCVEGFADSTAGKSGHYTPYPATWFNGDRYDDDVAEWQHIPVNGKGRETSSFDARGGFDEVLSRPAPAWAGGVGQQ